MKLQHYQKLMWQNLLQKIYQRKLEIIDITLGRYRYYYGMKIDWSISGDYADDPVLNQYYNELENIVFGT